MAIKSGTETTKNHRFKSFRERSEAIKIDPLKRQKKKAADKADESHFISSFRQNAELNLSTSFTHFMNKVSKHTGSLPMVLHNKDFIFDCIEETLEEKNEFSAEAILELLTNFVRDLGEEFEPYFGRTLSALIGLTYHHNLEVVEQTFNSMVYIFKYLARLLTSNLVPTYDYISVLLGRESDESEELEEPKVQELDEEEEEEEVVQVRKPRIRDFVARFASEVLSFLIRKCSHDGLNVIIPHILSTVGAQDSKYFGSVVNMFAESMKHTKNSLHSKTDLILATLFLSAANRDTEALVSAVLTSTLVHVDADSATVVFDALYAFTQGRGSYANVLYLTCVTAATKGDKVGDWKRAFAESRAFSETLDESAVPQFTLLVVSLIQNGELAQIFPNHRPLFDTVARVPLEYLALFETLAEVSADRFEQFAFSYLPGMVKTFVGDLERVAVFLSRLPDRHVACPEAVSELRKEITALGKQKMEPKTVFELWWRIRLFRQLASAEGVREVTGLVVRLLASLRDVDASVYVGSLYGQCLSLLGANATENVVVEALTLLDAYGHVEEYLEGLVGVSGGAQGVQMAVSDATMTRLCRNLTSASANVRTSTLVLLQRLQALRGLPESPLVAECALIASIPADFTTVRSLVQRVQKLGTTFTVTGTHSVTDVAVPCFLFGLLTVQFTPTHEAATKALVSVAERVPETVWELAYEWIRRESSLDAQFEDFRELLALPCQDDVGACMPSSDFNIDGLNKTFHASKTLDAALQLCETLFARAHPAEMPFFIRPNALVVLRNLPRLAEKHVQTLIPYLLWSEDDDTRAVAGGADSKLSDSWPMKDRLVLLDVFALFHNTKADKRGAEVYARFLHLLSNRHTSIQKAALKCVLTWNDKTVRKYKVNLFNLLEDAQFKDEMISFLKPSDTRVLHEDDEDAIFPLALRILYGRAQQVSKSGPRFGKRFAVFSTLIALPMKYTRMFVAIAVSRLELDQFLTLSSGESPQYEPRAIEADPEDLATLEGNCQSRTANRQIFFLELAEDMGKQLGARLASSMDILLDSVLYCMHYSTVLPSNHSAKRMSRFGFKTLIQLFLKLASFDWAPYLHAIFFPCVQTKMPTFAFANRSKASAMLQATFLWGSRPAAFPLFVYDEVALLRGCVALLDQPELNPAVVSSTILLFSSIFAIEDDVDAGEFDHVVNSSVPLLLTSLPRLLQTFRHFDVVTNIAKLLVTVCQRGYARDQQVKSDLVAVVAELVVENKVSWTIQVSLLSALAELIPVTDLPDQQLNDMYLNVSRLFKTVQLKATRSQLVAVFAAITTKIGGFSVVSSLIARLNAYSTKLLDAPDFDQRTSAFNDISQRLSASLTPLEWIPIVDNMLFYIRDDDLPIRNNATLALIRFFEAVPASPDVAGMVAIIDDAILPAVEVGMRETGEIVRNEFVAVLEHLVRLSAQGFFPKTRDMAVLLRPQDNDDANVFYNITHLQTLRRQKAVQYINLFVRRGALEPYSIGLLLNLIEHFGMRVNQSTQMVAFATYQCIGSMTRWMPWEQYQEVVLRFVGYVKTREAHLKQTARLLGGVAMAFADDPEEEEEEEDKEVTQVTVQVGKGRHSTSATVDVNAIPLGGEAVYEVPKPPAVVPLATSVLGTTSDESERATFLFDAVIPPIRTALNAKNHDQLTDRIPLGIPVVRFICALPKDKVLVTLPGTLTTLCQVMRAKQQELRDEMRRLLGNVAEILGPQYLSFLMRELKSALRRGAHLHILGYTVWYILNLMQPSLDAGDLNPVAATVAEIVMEDVFGVTGSDKDQEDYRSAMKEVKSQRSYETATILAGNVTLNFFTKLMDPVKTILLHKRLTLSVEKKAQEILRHFSLGLQRNDAAGTSAMLVMCFQIYQLTLNIESKYHEVEEAKSQKIVALDDFEDDYIVKLDAKAHKKTRDGMHIANLHLLVRFTFDTLRSAITGHPELKTAENMFSFLPFLTDGLFSTHEDVQIGALRILALVVDLPFPEMDDFLLKWGSQTLEIIAGCAETKTQLCQNAFRFLTRLFETQETFSIKETSLGYILNRVTPDLVESQGQNITYALIQAILGRQVVIPEVYDVMKHVANTMITHQQTNTRDYCRAIYFQFLTSYPQSRARLNKEFEFLINNLEYPFDSGRQSVLEMIHQLLTEVSDSLLQQTITSFFVALVLRLYNDDSSSCREMASQLIKILLQKAQGPQLTFVEDYLLTWVDCDLDNELLKVSLQVVGLYIQVKGDECNRTILKRAEAKVAAILLSSSADSAANLPWDLVYFSLQLWARLCDVIDPVTSKRRAVWDAAVQCLLYPHSWVRLSAARCVGILFTLFKERSADANATPLAFNFSNRELQTVAYRTARQLSTPGASQPLCTQAVKNLVYVVTVWEQTGYLYQKDSAEKDDEGDETETGEPATNWLLGRCSGIIRTTVKGKDRVNAKRASVQLMAACVQLLSLERVNSIMELVIFALFILVDQHEAAIDPELREIAEETLKMLQTKVGTSEYLSAHARVQQKVVQRRNDRKQEMSLLAMKDPAAYAEQKMKRNKKKRAAEKMKKEVKRQRT